MPSPTLATATYETRIVDDNSRLAKKVLQVESQSEGAVESRAPSVVLLIQFSLPTDNPLHTQDYLVPLGPVLRTELVIGIGI